MNPLRTTEAATLAKCEKAWAYRYLLDRTDPPSDAMSKGTLWHAVWDEWWMGGLNGAWWARAMLRIPEDRREDLNDRIVDDVMWMATRYDAWRGGDPKRTDWEVIDQEVELEGDFGFGLFQGRVDDIRIHKPTGQMYVGECKTMRDWRRLDILEVDFQITDYVALAQANGYPVVGVMYDAAKTYRWTRDEHKHPPNDSFQEVTLLRNADQIKATLIDLAAIDERRHAIAAGATPIRNLGQNCSFCSFRAECFEELAFPEDAVEWLDS